MIIGPPQDATPQVAAKRAAFPNVGKDQSLPEHVLALPLPSQIPCSPQLFFPPIKPQRPRKHKGTPVISPRSGHPNLAKCSKGYPPVIVLLFLKIHQFGSTQEIWGIHTK